MRGRSCRTWPLRGKLVRMAQAAQARSVVEVREASRSRRLENRGCDDGLPRWVRPVVAARTLHEVEETRGLICVAAAHGTAVEDLR